MDSGEGKGERKDGGIKGNGLIWNENSVETRRSPGNRDFAGGLTSALPVKPARIVPLQRSPPPPFVRSRAHTKPLSSSSSSPSSLSVVPTRGSTTATWPANLSFHPPRTLFFFFLRSIFFFERVRIRIDTVIIVCSAIFKCDSSNISSSKYTDFEESNERKRKEKVKFLEIFKCFSIGGEILFGNYWIDTFNFPNFYHFPRK